MDDLEFRIESPADAPFFINCASGKIINTQILDSEIQPMYVLNISAADGLHMTYTKVKVMVVDENDNGPVFARHDITQDVSMDTNIGEMILRACATDVDQGMNGFVTHWVIGSEGKFHLDPFSGVMTLTGALNGNDVKEAYHMTIYARDHGDEPRVANISVSVRVSRTNLHTPEYVDFVYDLSIQENLIPTNHLLQINVTDLDEGVASEVTLTLSPSSSHPFQIDTENKLWLHEELDYETQPFYNLEILATDGASDAKASSNMIRVTVGDVNDNRPYFLPVPSHVHLEVESGSSQLVTQVIALDNDGHRHGNDQIGYQLLVGFDVCTIDASSGEIFTKPTTQAGTYSLKIQVIIITSTCAHTKRG